MAELTADEQNDIKRWIVESAHPEVILRMQNNSQKLSFIYSDHFAQLGRRQGYEEQEYGETVTFADKAEIHKAYVATTTGGVEAQGFMALLSRGGHQRLIYKQELEQKATRAMADANPQMRRKMLFDMALVAAQTGFSNLTKEEFAALQTATFTVANLPNPQDNYGDIASKRPGALRNTTFKQFIMLRDEALKEKNLLLNQPTPDELQQIEAWIERCTDRDVVLKMQNEAHESQLAPSRSDRPDGLTLAEGVSVFKDYISGEVAGVTTQGLFATIHRGGLSRKTDLVGGPTRSGGPIENMATIRARTQQTSSMRLWRGLVEAQTGFFNIEPDEFAALQRPPSPTPNLPSDGRDRYAEIFNSRPAALSKITFSDFVRLRKKMLTKKGWLKGTAAAEPAAVEPAAGASAATEPAPAAPGSFAAKFSPTPTNTSWTAGEEARASQSELLGQVNADLAEIAERSSRIDTLIGQLAAEQAAQKTAIARVQARQEKLATSAQADGKNA